MQVTLAIEESMDIHAKATQDKHYEYEEKDLHDTYDYEGVYVDDVSGEHLDAKQVKVARQAELKTFEEMKVYKYVLKSDMPYKGKLVGTRWLDSIKNGKMKSRLVAQEFAKGSNRDDIFAGTPPLMASRVVLSDTASRSKTGSTSRRLAILDVKRAFLHGLMEEEVFIELPDEDAMKKLGYVGILVKAMYGTRSAPLMWQKVVKKTMLDMNFHACVTTPCMYYNKSRDMFVVAHVDDFLCSGEMSDLQWMKAELEKQFELTSKFIGSGQEGEYLGRKIRWGHTGISIEGENKYIDLMATEWDLLQRPALNTPGSKEDQGGDEELSPGEATSFRRSAAMGIYMAQDRGDISFASKEVARGMAKPTRQDAMKLKKMIRYLMGARRRATHYHWQDPPGEIRGYTDSDWAGCTRTRRSTSGGVLLYGQHLVHHWSSTQAVVALSSMEAELNALVKGTAEIICLKNMLAECGEEVKAYLCTDSSAAHGALHRQGCGKVKHLACRQLWVQDVVAQGTVKILKVPRLDNPSDAFTHYWSVSEGQLHFKKIGIVDPYGELFDGAGVYAMKTDLVKPSI
jgi:hypothetical protein